MIGCNCINKHAFSNLLPTYIPGHTQGKYLRIIIIIYDSMFSARTWIILHIDYLLINKATKIYDQIKIRPKNYKIWPKNLKSVFNFGLNLINTSLPQKLRRS